MIPIEPLKCLVQALTCLDVVWETEPRPLLGAGSDGKRAYIMLSLMAYGSIGVDDYRQTFDEANDKIVSTISGNRLFTISMRCNSLSPELQPFDVLERVRVQLRGVTAAATYAAQNMAFVRTESIVPLRSQKVNNQALLCAVLDVTFSRAANSSATDDPGDYIAKVNGGSASGGPVGPIPIT